MIQIHLMFIPQSILKLFYVWKDSQITFKTKNLFFYVFLEKILEHLEHEIFWALMVDSIFNYRYDSLKGFMFTEKATINNNNMINRYQYDCI